MVNRGNGFMQHSRPREETEEGNDLLLLLLLLLQVGERKNTLQWCHVGQERHFVLRDRYMKDQGLVTSSVQNTFSSSTLISL